MSVNVRTALNPHFFQEFRNDVMRGFDAAPNLWREYAMEVPSNSRSTLHGWLGNQAGVREWQGQRVHRDLSSRTWEVVNKDYELAYQFDMNQLDDDMSGFMAQAVRDARNMGDKFARHDDYLVAQALIAGRSALCWDGQFFFDTDHPTDVDGVTSGTFDNDLTLGLSGANFGTAYDSLMQFELEDGSPMVYPGGIILMVPPQLRTAAHQAVGSTPPGSTTLNTNEGLARVVVNPWLKSESTRWYLIASMGDIKPMMIQRRKPLEVLDDSSLVYEARIVRFGGSQRKAASYTLPQLALTSAP